MSNPESHFIMPKPSKNPRNVLVKRSFFKQLRRKIVLYIAYSVSVTPLHVWSNDTSENGIVINNNHCTPALIAPKQIIPEKVNDVNAAPQNFEADRLLQPLKTQYLLQGNAVFKQPGLVVLSDEAVYDKNEKTAVFNGNVEVHQPELTITADNARIDNENETAVFNHTEYQMLPSRTHGQSNNIQLDQKSQKALLARASLTTCKVNSDQSVDWDLKFDELVINNETRRVVGKNTTLYFKDVPIFYTPYFDYPLDNRASGLLFPETGSYKSLTQQKPNQYIKIPYYFNISPNMDDTLTAIPMTQRGLALENEFRYIAKQNEITHGAKITLTGLQDQLTASEGIVSSDANGNLTFGDKRSERWRASIETNQNWGHGFTSTLNWDEVSDENFFADIPVQNDLKTATQKQRNAQLNYKKGAFGAYIQLLSYLRLQNAAVNYEKRPEIGMNYAKYISDFDFDIAATVTDFVVPVSGHSKPEAVRFHTAPTLSYQNQNSFGSLKATLVANQTQYNMRDNGFNPSTRDSISRFIPQFAVHGGLVFERDIAFNKQTYIQTLEPEIQYLYTPYEDQSDIALFDTANRSVDFSNLFALNRFTGADRIGDTSQVAAAISTKLFNPQGKQIAEAGIGQIAYLQDRKVTLSGITETEKFSDYYLKASINLKAWYLSSTTRLNNQDQSITNTNTRIKWQQANSLALINHTLNNQGQTTETEMLSVGGYTKMNTSWDIGLYGSYDMRNQNFYETQLGLRHDSCCWAVEFVAEHTQLENGLYNDEIKVQFEFKGLSSTDSKFKQALTQKLNF